MAEPAKPIKAGDTVQLKSGGPVMTVTTIEVDYAYVVWFKGVELATQSKIKVAALKHAEPSSGVEEIEF